MSNLLYCLTESKVRISEGKNLSFAIVRVAYPEEWGLTSFWKSTDIIMTTLDILSLSVLITLSREISSFETTACLQFSLGDAVSLLFGMVIP